MTTKRAAQVIESALSADERTYMDYSITAQVAADALDKAAMLRSGQPRTANGVKPVVAIDLDGTLAPWHHHFACFLEDYTGKQMGIPRTQPFWPVKWDGSVPFWKWLGVSKDTYRQAKIAFRQGGFKRWMPAYDGAADLTRAIRRAGAEVWICTTRPYLRLDNIDPDTRHWLRRNGIQYDGVIFGDNKYRTLVDIVGAQNVVCVLDDLPEQIRQAERLGLTAVTRDQPYNANSEPINMVYDVLTATAILPIYITEHKR